MCHVVITLYIIVLRKYLLNGSNSKKPNKKQLMTLSLQKRKGKIRVQLVTREKKKRNGNKNLLRSGNTMISLSK